MNMAIYDIAGEVARSASILKIDVNAEGTCRHQWAGKCFMIEIPEMLLSYMSKILLT